MRLPAFHLAQKISGTITILSLCVALLITIVFEKEITKDVEYTSKELIEIIAQNVKNELSFNYLNYQSLKKSTINNELTHKFWLDVVENTVAHLSQNFEALILDNEGNIIAPKTLKTDITLVMRKKAIASSNDEPSIINTPFGRATHVTKTLKVGEYYLSLYFFHKNFEEAVWDRRIELIQVAAVIIVIGLILSIILSKHLTKPLQSLNKAAILIPNEDITSTKIWTKIPDLPLDRSDEIGTLANSFHYMVNALQKNMHETLRLTVAQEKAESELQLAKSIQQNILPKDFLTIKHYETLQEEPFVHGLVLPAREVGGDLFDVFWLDDENFCFAMGDVSDKGVPAALFMSITLTLIRVIMRHTNNEDNPAKALEYINQTLCINNTSNMFVTLIIGTVNYKTGHLTFANAGHSPPLCLHADNSLESLPTHKDMVVASFEEVEYTNISHQLQANDRIFLYTDGVNEALNSNGERLGNEALYDMLKEGNDLNPKKFNEYIVNKIKQFSENHPQYDDIALLNFIWKPTL